MSPPEFLLPATGTDPRDPTDPPDPTDVGSRLAALETALAGVAERLADDTARAAARERVIDRQHAEIERLRSDERGGRLRPVIVDLYRLRTDLLRQAATCQDAGPAGRVSALLRSYADDVAESLERCGVSVAPCEIGVPFEPGRHQVSSVVPTADPRQDGTVAEVVSDGYAETDGGRVVAPTRITLYRYAEGDIDG